MYGQAELSSKSSQHPKDSWTKQHPSLAVGQHPGEAEGKVQDTLVFSRIILSHTLMHLLES